MSIIKALFSWKADAKVQDIRIQNKYIRTFFEEILKRIGKALNSRELKKKVSGRE